MEVLNHAIDLIRKNNYSASLKILKKIYAEKSLDQNLKIIVLENILTAIHRSKNIGHEKYYLFELGNIYFEIGAYKKATPVFEKLIHQKKYVNEQILYRLWFSLKSLGEVYKSKGVAELHLQYLYKLRRIEKGEQFLEDLLNQGGVTDLVYKFKLLFISKSGHLEKFNQFFSFLMKDYKWTINNPKIAMFDLLRPLFEKHGKYWEQSPVYLELRIALLLDKFEKQSPIMVENIPKYKRQIIHSLYNLLLFFGMNEKICYWGVKIGLGLGRKKLAILSHEKYKSSSYPVGKELKQFFEESLPKIVSLKDDSEVLSEGEFDLGEDLFDKTSVIDVTSLKIKEIERDISIVKSNDLEKEKLVELLVTLKELDEDHELVKDLNELVIDVHGTKSIEKKIDVDEIQHDLLSEIQSHILAVDQKERKEFETLSKGVMLKIIQFCEIKELRNCFKDYIYSFNSIEFFDVSLAIIKKLYLESIEEIDFQLELDYFRIATLMLKKDYYHAKDILHEVLEEKPLMADERICFSYLMAETNEMLGNISEALKYYKFVKDHSPRYRMAAQRLNRF